MLNQKNNKIMTKRRKKIEMGEQQKALYEWAEDTFFENRGEVSRFLAFIKQEGREPLEVVSYTDFLVLKTKFDNWFKFDLYIKIPARNPLPVFYYVLIFMDYIVIYIQHVK